jgi:hypothetical protein
MSLTDPESIALLKSIDVSLKELVSFARGRQAAAARQAPPMIATDSDLDGKYGNPLLKFKPRDWTGPDFKNRRFSECPAALLDQVADMLDYFARKAEEKKEITDKGKPVAPYKRQDAARARGWAKRIRAGYVAPGFEKQSIAPPFAAPAAADPFAESGFEDDGDGFS